MKKIARDIHSRLKRDMPPDNGAVGFFEKAFEKLEQKKKLELETRKIDVFKRTIEGIVTRSKKTRVGDSTKKTESGEAKPKIVHITEEVKLKLADLNQQNLTLQREIKELQSTKKKVSVECRQLHTANEEMQAQMIEKENELKESNQKFKEEQLKQTQKIEFHAAKIAEIEKQKNLVEQNNESLTLEVGKLEKSLKTDIRRNENMLNEIKRENGKLEEKIQKGETAKEECEKQFRTNKNLNEEILIENENLRIFLKEEIEKFQCEKKNLLLKETNLTEENQKNKTEIQKLKENMEKLTGKKNLRDADFLTVRKELEKSISQIEQMETNERELERTISEMEKKKKKKIKINFF